jgi:hypothetical protein
MDLGSKLENRSDALIFPALPLPTLHQCLLLDLSACFHCILGQYANWPAESIPVTTVQSGEQQ